MRFKATTGNFKMFKDVGWCHIADFAVASACDHSNVIIQM